MEFLAKIRTKVFASSCVVLLGAFFSNTASSYQLFYNESDFMSAAPYVAVETFEEAIPEFTAAGADQARVTGTLDANTDNGVFSPGDILPGLAVTGVIFHGRTTSLTIFTGTDFFAMNGDTAVIPSNDAYAIQVDFNPTVTAVGLNLIFETPSQDNAGITFFDENGDIVLGELEITDWTYLGVIAEAGDASISRLLFDNPFGINTGRFEAIDNVAFGNSTSVPEPSTLLMSLLGLGLLWRKESKEPEAPPV